MEKNTQKNVKIKKNNKKNQKNNNLSLDSKIGIRVTLISPTLFLFAF